MKTVLSLIAAFAVTMLVLLAALARESPAHAEQAPASASALGQGEAVDSSASMLDEPQVN